MHKQAKNPTESKSEIHEGKVLYLGKWRTIQYRNGWAHVEIRNKTERRLVSLEQIESEKLHGQSEPVYIGYILEGLFQVKPNAYFDKLLERI